MNVLNLFPLPPFTIQSQQALQWRMKKLLKAMHCLFKNVTARREDCTYWLTFVPFTTLWPQMGWKSSLQRGSTEVWPMLQHFVDTVHRKRLPNPATASSETTEAVQLLILAILQFFKAVCWSFRPFSTKQQMNKGFIFFSSSFAKFWVVEET